MKLRHILLPLAAVMMQTVGWAQAPGTGSAASRETAAAPVSPGRGGATATVFTEGGGFRVGRLLGAAVWSSDNHELGKVEDVLFAPKGGGEPTVVLSVGGFLGWGETLVALPLSRLQHSERWVLPGVLADTVRELPAFRFE